MSELKNTKDKSMTQQPTSTGTLTSCRRPRLANSRKGARSLASVVLILLALGLHGVHTRVTVLATEGTTLPAGDGPSAEYGTLATPRGTRATANAGNAGVDATHLDIRNQETALSARLEERELASRAGTSRAGGRGGKGHTAGEGASRLGASGERRRVLAVELLSGRVDHARWKRRRRSTGLHLGSWLVLTESRMDSTRAVGARDIRTISADGSVVGI